MLGADRTERTAGACLRAHCRCVSSHGICWRARAEGALRRTVAGALCALPVRVVPRYLSFRQYGAGSFCGSLHGAFARPSVFVVSWVFGRAKRRRRPRGLRRGRGAFALGTVVAPGTGVALGTGVLLAAGTCRDGGCAQGRGRGVAGTGGFSAENSRDRAQGRGRALRGTGRLLRCGDAGVDCGGDGGGDGGRAGPH